MGDVKKISVLCIELRYTEYINTFHLGVISKIKCFKSFLKEVIIIKKDGEIKSMALCRGI